MGGAREHAQAVIHDVHVRDTHRPRRKKDDGYRGSISPKREIDALHPSYGSDKVIE